MPLISANATAIHYEITGDGPPLLFVAGAGGDAGYWTATAAELADAFTVVTYDRRGNSRSPSTPGHATSLAEQADDAAALLRELGLAPAIVVGTSFGAIVTATLVERHPLVVERAVLHEPPLIGVLPDGEEIGAQLMSLIGDGMARGGPPAAMDLFMRSVATASELDSADPLLVARLLANAEVFFGGELELVASYRPDPVRLRATGVEVTVAAGRDDPQRYLARSAGWLADQLGAPVLETSGAHLPYNDRPSVFADELRALLAEETVAPAAHRA
ncbi:alpha/beta fold hydrolase [Actinomycetospora sp. CA-053990]|uniref:alpha/beta fold hydrolase n=1 Tax=Actinomycetospora sp. CA-053990 TaxID=3239891 RepID=UPI003D93E1A0